jgi:hypothetical protein
MSHWCPVPSLNILKYLKLVSSTRLQDTCMIHKARHSGAHL